VRGVTSAFHELLTEAGYDEVTVREAARWSRFLAGGEARPRTSDPRLDVLIELFALGEPVTPAVAEAAVAPLPVDDLIEAGLLERRAEGVVARCQVIPFEGLLLFGDQGGESSAEVVLALSQPAAMTAWMTPRAHVGSFLDLGTGSGLQALLGTRHSDHVVAVDASSRALAYAALGESVNDVAGIEWRCGRGLEPVAGERFDRIVCTPPYVVSPDDDFTFRDSDDPELIGRLCADLPEHLNEAGVAVMLCMWPHADADDWHLAPAEWAERSGCDAVILCFETVDPLTHAARWNLPPVRLLAPEQFRQSIGRWRRYYETSEIGALSFGAVILHRHTRGDRWALIERASAGLGVDAGQQVDRIIAGHEFIIRTSDLLDACYAMPAEAHVSQGFVRRGRGWDEELAEVSVPDQLGLSAMVSASALPVLFACDGRSTLRELIEGGGGLDDEAVLRAVWELLTRGLLIPLPFEG
jgi:methylase of polypeptide subunit release factors